MIEIEDVTRLETERQAVEVLELVGDESEWLKIARPDTLGRYRNLVKATESLGRAVMSDVISTHIIRQDKVAIGLATIIPFIQLRHAGEQRSVGGRQIDYWTRDGLNGTHIEIAETLESLHDYHGRVLGLLSERELERACGIPRTMRQLGDPGRIEVVGEDIFGIGKITEPLHLYHGEVYHGEALLPGNGLT